MINYIYCTQCKTKLSLDGMYPKCPECKITYYRNSKPTAGILPIKDGKVLLSRRSIEPFVGCLDIIGGFLENGESPHDGAKREAKEETGLNVEPKEILGIYMDQYGNGGEYTINIHYIGEILSGEMIVNEREISSLVWVPIEQVPTNEGFNNTKQALNDLKEKYL